MGKKYRRKTNRSRRNPPRDLRGRVTVLSDGEGSHVQLTLPIAELLSATHDALEALVKEAGVLVIRGMLEEEVEQLTGHRYEHQRDRSAVRWGEEEGHIVLGGRKLAIKRPRVRGIAGCELPIGRYQMFRAGERMKGAVERCIVRGVSTRNYEGLIDGICDGYGVRRSSVSRHWKAASTKELDQLVRFPLGDLEIAVIMIDSVSFHEHVLVVALGVLADGRKRVLGLWQGATENAQLCKDLLADLVDRGLAVDRRHLFVLDGAKALHRAV
jgi:putative transposase